MPADLELNFSVADYHRTRPLLTGDVTLEGIKPNFYAAAPGEACLRPVYEEFDVAEMSLSWYVMARDRGEPVYALPIFPLRMFVQPYFIAGPIQGSQKPQDLVGKRVGMDRYRLTVGLWARGILQERLWRLTGGYSLVHRRTGGRGIRGARKAEAHDGQQGSRATSARWGDRCADIAQCTEIVSGWRSRASSGFSRDAGKVSKTISIRPTSSRSPTPWSCVKTCC